ncbi:hypothetical protein [Hansschlegelia zhihuaiae]|uniref:Terminase small subunit n=1 Tax=Hansschlegelia zhihuaiae TaxID=405005 RepID=A0A4Q0MGI8_9HYPH|nr:hypothetical protein [Hansschlegelia zhihuaiae]RXF72109.1 hypothetical protein EK403_14970 [Hansschlegelia zhihuaiae]
MTRQVDGQKGLVTAAEYARLRGVSKQAASKWPLVRVEDPERPGRFLVDVAATDARRGIEQNPLKRQAPTPASPLAERDRQTPAPSLVPDEAQRFGRQSRIEREHWAAKNERLNYEERIGALISRPAAERAQTEMLKAIRARVMGAGARIAERAAELNDPRAVRALIDEENRRALTAAAQDIDDLAEALEAEDAPAADDETEALDA